MPISPNDVADVAASLPASWPNILFLALVATGTAVIYGRKFLAALRDGIAEPVAPGIAERLDAIAAQEQRIADSLEAISGNIAAHVKAVTEDRERRADEEEVRRQIREELEKAGLKKP